MIEVLPHGHTVNGVDTDILATQSSISLTEFQNLNVSHLVLQLSLLNPLKPGVKLRMKM